MKLMTRQKSGQSYTEHNSHPLITAVITTCRRSPEMVARALNSVVAQSYDNLEIILVNDFPEDKRLAAQLANTCKSFFRPVCYLEMNRNSGANAARNRGAGQASGEFLCFLDDDDEWFPNKLSEQLRLFDSADVAVVYCNTIINIEKKTKEHVHFTKPMPEGIIYDRLFEKNIIGSTSFPMIRKSAFDESGGFDEGMPAMQDLELWLRLTRKYEARYATQPLGKYYFYAGDRISSHADRRIAAYEMICEKHSGYLKTNKKAKASFNILGVTVYLNGRKFKKAISLWLEACRLFPLEIKRNAYTACKILIRFFVSPRIV